MIRAWQGFRQPRRCQRCGKRLVWMIDDQGRNVPIREGCAPVQRITDDKGRRFDVFEASARHDCRPTLKGLR